jgi:hypothetical protein
VEAFFIFTEINVYTISMSLEKVKYPIGTFQAPASISRAAVNEAIAILKVFPEQIKLLTYSLTNEQLAQPYREGGWTIQQLIHHISDSHNHAYNRFRWTLSEDTPTIKAYDQDAYAAMSDYSTAPIAWSIAHIEVIHQKLTYIMDHMSSEDWKRTFIHPQTGEETSLGQMALQYAWHSMHHFAHIKNAL